MTWAATWRSVFPAYAGMFPPCFIVAIDWVGFPRIRGDFLLFLSIRFPRIRGDVPRGV